MSMPCSLYIKVDIFLFPRTFSKKKTASISTGGVSCYTEQEENGRSEEEEEGKEGGEESRNVRAEALCSVIAQPQKARE